MRLDPRRGPTHCSSSHAVVASCIQNRGRLITHVSSGPIFLTKYIYIYSHIFFFTSWNKSSFYSLSYNISHQRVDFCLKIRFLYYVPGRWNWTLLTFLIVYAFDILFCLPPGNSFQCMMNSYSSSKTQHSFLFQEAFSYPPPSFHMYFYQSLLCANFVLIPIFLFHSITVCS